MISIHLQNFTDFVLQCKNIIIYLVTQVIQNKLNPGINRKHGPMAEVSLILNNPIGTQINGKEALGEL
jgi:hypothetical protein